MEPKLNTARPHGGDSPEIDARRAELETLNLDEIRTLARADGGPMDKGYLVGHHISARAPLPNGSLAGKSELVDAIIDAEPESAPALDVGDAWNPNTSRARDCREAAKSKAENKEALKNAFPPPPAPAPAPAAPVGGDITLRDLVGQFGGGKDERVDQIVLDVAATSEELETLRDKIAAALPILDALDADKGGTSAARTLAVAAAATGTCAISRELVRKYGAAGHPMRGTKHLVLFGAPSVGKSYNVRQFAKTNGYDHFIEHGCAPAMDAIEEMKGSPKPDGDGGWIIPDGSLAKAVRLAATDSVCLFLDEVPRLYETAKEWLLPFLTGVKVTDASGDTELFYSLTTARPDGAGALEKITCPARNLHIICAGNLERRIPDAFWSRFRPYRIEFDKAQIAATSAAILNHYGIEAHGLPSMYSELVDESRKARAEMSVEYPLDLRVLEEAASFSADMGTPDESATALEITLQIRDFVGGWDAALQGQHTGEGDPLIKKWRERLEKFAKATAPAPASE